MIPSCQKLFHNFVFGRRKMMLFNNTIRHISSTTIIHENDVAILGIPFDNNSSYLKGPAKAPQIILEAINSDSSNFDLAESSVQINSKRLKVLPIPKIEDYWTIENYVSEILEKKAIPLIIGGDHSITFPCIKAFSRFFNPTNFTIIHFDAHSDLYDELDGNRYSHACPFARIQENNLCGNLIQIGIRTNTTHLNEQSKKFGVKTIEMKDCTEIINNKIFDTIKGPVYISFDMDVLDPAFAPGVSHHEPGGFSSREILNLIGQKLSKLNIVGIDLVEYNPERDINLVTAMTAAKIVKEFLGVLLMKRK